MNAMIVKYEENGERPGLGKARLDLREGGNSQGIYIVDSGEVDVLHGGKPVNCLRPGDFFGELSALFGEPLHINILFRTRYVCNRVLSQIQGSK